MRILKANTAVRLVVGPLCDKTTGLAKPSMTVTNMAMNMWHEHDDGSAPTKSIDAVSFTASGGDNDMVELAGGYYDIEITAAQLNITAGRASFCIYDDDVILPYFEEWLVVPANVFDSIMGTDKLDINVAEMAAGIITSTVIATGAIDADAIADNAIDAGAIATGAITNAKFAAGAIDAAAIATDAIDADAIKADAITEIQNGLATPTNITAGTIATVTNLTNLPTMPADWITASGLKADAVAEIADGVWDEAMAGHVGAGTLGKAMADVLEDTGTTLPAAITNLDGDVADVFDDVGDVKAELDTVLADTNEIQAELADGGRTDLILDAINDKTTNLPSDPADQSLLMAAIAGVPAAVWAVLTSTLTVAGTVGKWVMDLITGIYNSLAAIPAVSLAMPNSGDIDVYVYDTLSFSITDLGSLANLEALYVTFKEHYDDEDADAILQLEQTQGLLIANGATATAGDGSITIDDEPTGDITGVVAASVMDDLDAVRSCVFDVKIIRSAGVPVETLAMGKAKFHRTVTRAIE